MLHHQAPFIRLVVPFCIGIVCSSYFPKDIASPLLVAFLSASLFSTTLTFAFLKFKNYSNRWVSGTFYSLSLAFMGYLLSVIQIEKFNSNHFSNHISTNTTSPYFFSATITDEPTLTQKAIKLEVNIHQVLTDSLITKTTGKCILFLKTDSTKQLSIGDTLSFNQTPKEISPPKNPEEFNYKRYLFHHHIYHQVFIRSNQVKISPAKRKLHLYTQAYEIRNTFLDFFKNQEFTPEEFAVISALLLGKKDDLNEELMQAYSSAGAMHVLAVSGLHVGIIFLLLNSILLFPKTRSFWRVSKSLLLLIGIWSYAFISGLSPSVIRAATMFSFIIIGRTFSKSTNIYNTLALSAFCILLIKPFMLMEVGFQLSYLAVFGIVYLQPKIYAVIKSKYWLIDKCSEITAVSIAAQIATAPLGLLYFHQFPNYFFLSNLIVIPAAFCIVVLGITVLVLAPITLLSDLIAQLLAIIISLLNQIVSYIEKLPFSIVGEINISVLETWSIYLIVILFSLSISKRKVKLFITSLCVSLLFLVFQAYENNTLIHKKSIVFYSINKHKAIDFIKGDQHAFIADQALLDNKKKMRFHVEHNWWANNLNISSFAHLQMNKDSSLLFFDNTSILIWKNQHFTQQYLKVDIVYLDQPIKNDNFNQIDCGLIIIGNKLNHYYRKKVVDKYGQKIKLYDLKTEGALCINTKNQGL